MGREWEGGIGCVRGGRGREGRGWVKVREGREWRGSGRVG